MNFSRKEKNHAEATNPAAGTAGPKTKTGMFKISKSVYHRKLRPRSISYSRSISSTKNGWVDAAAGFSFQWRVNHMNTKSSRIEIHEILPNNELAEKSLIENLIFCPSKTESVKKIVIPDDFYSMMRSKIYARIIEFHKAGRSWNLVTLENSFRNDPHLMKYRDFFDELLPFTGELAGQNARIIKECADERKLIAATYQANMDLFNAVGVGSVRVTLEQALIEVA